jgi:hypothetical protein
MAARPREAGIHERFHLLLASTCQDYSTRHVQFPAFGVFLSFPHPTILTGPAGVVALMGFYHLSSSACKTVV